MALCRQEVGLGVVAPFVGQDEVVAQVGGVAGPGDEVVHLRLPRQRLPAVEADALLHVEQDRAVGFEAGPLPAEQERAEVGGVPSVSVFTFCTNRTQAPSIRSRTSS